jgi:ribosome-associated toxin RatA of RatAB toxin-antitoxin module
VSIREGMQMIKRTSYTTVIETYDIAEPLLKATREHIKSEAIYQEFERLVKRWKAKPLKNNK